MRLAQEQELLMRENRLLQVMATVPAGQFLDGSFNPN